MVMDIVAVIVATAVGMGVGAIWYGPLLGGEWQKATGMTDEKIASANMPLIMTAALVLELIAAVFLVLMVNRGSVISGVQFGSMAALFFSIGLGVNYLFERQSIKLYLINIGHMSLVFILMGAIIGFLL